MSKCRLDIENDVLKTYKRGLAEKVGKFLLPTDSLDTFYVNSAGDTKAGAASISKAVFALNEFWNAKMADFITWDGNARVFVRPPSYVVDYYWEAYKKKNNITEESPDYYRVQDEDFINELFPSVESQQNVKAQEIATKFANNLVSQTGINYKMISAEQAAQITTDTTAPWNGEPAFYYQDTVYFVENGFKLNNVLHEYAHPIVRSLYLNNKDLFNKLYSDILATEEGVNIFNTVTELYPEFTAADPNFLQEVFVRALEQAALQKANKISSTPGFNSFISNLLFAIKQLIRKVFGKGVKIEKLSIDTTLDQLADMLTGENFILTTEIITPQDLVSYARSNQTLYNDLNKVDTQDLIRVVNRFFVNSKTQLNRISTNKNYSDFVSAITTDSGRSILKDIVDNLRVAETTTVDDKVKKFKDDLDKREKQITAIVRSSLQTDILLDRVLEKLVDMKSMSDTKEVINQTFYYDILLRNWNKFIQETINGLSDSGLRTDSSLFALFSRMSNKTAQANRLINEIYKKGVGGILTEQIEPLAKNVDNYFTEKLKKLKSENASAREIKKTEEEWNRLKLNRATIDDYLSGMRGDVNSLSAYVESFASSPDPIISSFSVFLDNAYTDVELKAKKNKDDFLRELLPALKEAGYSDKNITSLMKELVFEEEVIVRDKNGNASTVKKLVLLNPFKAFEKVTSQFQFDIEEAKRLGDIEKARLLNKQYRQFSRDYMHDEFVPEFYAKEKIYDSELGSIIYQRKQDILADIADIDQRVFEDLTEDEAFEQKKILWKKYSQLASLRDEVGKLKIGDELEMAKIEKKYREESRKFYESKEITGLFEFKLNQFKQDLLDKDLLSDSQDFKDNVNDWLNSNTRLSINEKFYEDKKIILDKIKAITDTLPKDVAKKLQQDKLWEELIDISVGFRNADGQIVASEMSEERIKRVKELQKELMTIKNNMAGFSGLNKEQFERYLELARLIKSKRATINDKEEFKELDRLKTEGTVDKLTKKALLKLYADLQEMQYKEPTDDYLSAFNASLEAIDPTKIAAFSVSEITTSNAENFLKPAFLSKYFKASPEFKKWFLDNHIETERYNAKTKKDERVYERLYVWNVTLPNDEKYYNTYTYNDVNPATGEITETTLYKIPTMDFYRRVVKKEYRTGYNKSTGKVERKVGVHVDNRGNWLPRTVAEGAKDDSYINKAYYDLQKSSPTKAKVLDVITKYTLLFQEDKTKYSKLYLDVPRFRKLKNELIGSSLNAGAQKVKTFIKQAKDAVSSSDDDFDQGFNYNDSFNLVKADIFDEEISSIPVKGLYKLDVDQVSLNVPYSLLQYMLSLEHQKKLIELNPLAQALQKVVNNPENAIKDTSKVNGYNWVTNNVKSFVAKKGKNVRAEAINTLIEREFKGQTREGWLSDPSTTSKVVDILQKQASFGMFAFNIFPSAVKNFGGAVTQMIIESGGGKYLNKRSYIQGQSKALKMMTDISANIYNAGEKSIDYQLVEIFDPIKGRFQERFGADFGRSMGTDLADSLMFGSGRSFSNGIYTAPRKWLENEGTLSLFAGMMIFKKIPRTINGQTNMISYIDAWEKESDGTIRLKSGIDQKYAPGGEEFKAMRNTIQEKSNDLQGAYSTMDKVLLDKYAVWRMFSGLRRYFTRMFVNRFSPLRYNSRTGDLTQGYYIAFMKFLKSFISRASSGNVFITEDEAYAAKKVITEGVSITLLSLIIAYLFDYDPDDEERFEKMRQRSGDLLSEDFNLGGWLINHGLVATLGTRQETITFLNPKEYVGLIYSGGAPTLGPISDKYKDFGVDLMHLVLNDNRAYYTRDVGPYSWQKENSPKIFNDVGYLFGFTGSQVDPVKALKGMEYQIRR